MSAMNILLNFKSLHTRLVSFTILCVLVGCQIEEGQLDSWRKADRGHLKVAAYALDPERPAPLRTKALHMLAEDRHYSDLLTIFDQTSKFEKEVKEHTDFLVDELINFMEKRLQNPSDEIETATAELAYYLLSIEAVRAKLKSRTTIIDKLVEWSLGYLRDDRKLVLPINAQAALVKPDELLSALILTADPDDSNNMVFEKLKKNLEDNLSNIKYVVKAHHEIHRVRSPVMTEAMASILLRCSQKAYAEAPQNITKELLDAMLENRNTTLLKFIIELGRDRKLERELLVSALNAAMQAAVDREVGREMLPVLKRIIKSKSAYSTLVFFSLELAWQVNKGEGLKEHLLAIDPEFNAPVSGTELKLEVDRFCKVVIGVKYKDEVRETLFQLLVDLKTQTDRWPARLLSASCVKHLYPDDFPRIMKKNQLFQKYYAKDAQQVAAWRSDGAVTLGQIFNEYMNPMGEQ